MTRSLGSKPFSIQNLPACCNLPPFTVKRWFIKRAILSTGQDTELAGYTVPDQAVSYVNLYYADDGKLLFEQCSNAGADSQYADGFYVLESDKEPSPWTLTYSLYDKDTACAVVAAKDADTYLVEAGVQDTAAVQADDGASKYVSTGERRYALISKADYWSGNANYRDFEKIG